MAAARTIEFHPIAAVFPLEDDDKIQALANDIREHGLREPVVIYEGKVLDGRNRLTACRIAGVEPKFETFGGSRSEAVSFSWSENFHRRHLNASQASIAESKRRKLDEEYAAELDREKTAAKQRQSAGGKSKVPQRIAEPKSNGEVREQRAKTVGTNRQYVNDADKIVEKRPDLADKILKGEMTIPQAKREMSPPPQKPRAQFPDSDWFDEWLETIRMRSSGINLVDGGLEKLLNRPGWDHEQDGLLHPKLAGLAATLTKMEKEFASWRKKHGKTT